MNELMTGIGTLGQISWNMTFETCFTEGIETKVTFETWEKSPGSELGEKCMKNKTV